MEGLIDEDDESSNNGWRKWDGYEIADHDQEGREYENGHEDMERCKLFDDHELPVCNIRRFKMIKYSFGDEKTRMMVWTLPLAAAAVFDKRREMWLHLRPKEVDENSWVVINTPYPSRKIRHICVCTHQRPRRKQDPIRRIHQGRYGIYVSALTKDHEGNKIQYAVSRRRQYAIFKLYGNKIFLKISNVVPTPRNPQYAVSNTLDTPYRTDFRPYK
ncbi:hypothetical protein Tco_0154626 [Tanacetum coccineum]